MLREDAKGEDRIVLLLWIALTLACARIAWTHLSLFRMLDPAELFSFNARPPFTYRLFLPFLLSPLRIDFANCATGLNAPIGSCADVAALIIDTASLFFATALMLSTFRILARAGAIPFLRPELVAPILLWTVTFSYVAVPNSSIYYAYDFPELLFFALTARLAVAAPGYAFVLPPLLLLAATCKETALFMVPVYLIYAWCMRPLTRAQWVAAGVAAALVAASKYALYAYVIHYMRPDLAAAPVVYENQVVKNLRQFANPMAWFAWTGLYGGAAVLLAAPVAARPGLNRAIFAVIAGWMVILLAVGLPREMRLFGPMIFLLAIPLQLRVERLLYGGAAPSRPG